MARRKITEHAWRAPRVAKLTVPASLDAVHFCTFEARRARSHRPSQVIPQDKIQPLVCSEGAAAVYAGITNNIERRALEHADRFSIKAISDTMPRIEGRAIE